MKIFLDAGHGGKDSGAVHGSRLEKNDVLKFTLALGEKLKQKGLDVNYSRTTDVFVELSQRAKKANIWNANYFISIHRNSATVIATGVETWVYSRANSHTMSYGTALNKGIVAGIGLSNRGVKRGIIGNPNLDYAVNRETKMPSALVEIGFISNNFDNNAFDSRFNDTVNSLADSIVNFAV